MRCLLLLSALLLTACSEAVDDDPTAFCEALATSNDGCWEEALDAECRTRYAQCGENITVAESCPVQLGC